MTGQLPEPEGAAARSIAAMNRAPICVAILALSLGVLPLVPAIGEKASAPPDRAGPQGTKEPSWWAFRPLRKIPVPDVKDSDWAVNSVDRFIRAAQEKKGLTPSPLVGGRTLVRRVTFDLTGLPPSAEEVSAFVAASSNPNSNSRAPTQWAGNLRSVRSVGSVGPVRPQPSSTTSSGTIEQRAYEALVNRLLASPRFGERWARHWLDLARYADSDGLESDADRPTAYHYRDFVIRAFNADLPYDTFIRWQLAGDEYEPDNPLAVSATGFVTAGTYYRVDVPMEEEKVRARLNELDDMIGTTGVALLGLTVGCARCHDHKYDPIPQLDYYRLMAAFNAGDRTEVPLVPRPEAARRKAAEKEWKQQHETARKELESWLAEQKKPLTPGLRAAKINALPIDAAAMALLRDNPEDARAKELARRHDRALRIEDGDYHAHLSEAQRARWDALAASLKEIEATEPTPVPTAFAMADFGAAPRPTWLLERGDLYRKKEQLELGFLTALTHGPPPSEYWRRARAAGDRKDTTYQRRALADWITDTRHGAGALLARVIVNRIWQHHFGEGLVRTVNDFGTRGEPPSHPKLLEWLAFELVRGGWRLKPIHRLIVTSAAYRQAIRYDAVKVRLDPENRLLWRRRPRRIEAEAFRDALLAVSGSLNPESGGPAFRAPIQAEAIQARNVTNPYPPDLQETPDTRRRSVYMFHKRVVQYPLAQAFDGPDAAASCGRRPVTTVAPQALVILNEPFVRRRAGEFAGRLVAEAGDEPGKQVDHAFRMALARAPSPTERAASVRFLEQQVARRAVRDGAEARRLTLADFAQALFGYNEFMYVD